MPKQKDLSDETRNGIAQFLLANSSNGKPFRGKMLEAQEKFSVARRTISMIWAEAKKQLAQGNAIKLVNQKKHVQRKKKVEINLSLIESVELPKRGTIRKLAAAINISKSTVGRWVKSGQIRAHTNAIKPDLTAANKLLRLEFSLDAIMYDTLQKVFQFQTMSNTVHIDEKWFYLTRGSHRFYLTPGEAEPHRTCQNKKFISKVMFMCAVARPIFASDGSVIFDGKIGIFPFTTTVPAQRSSKNRVTGTLVTKAMDSVTKDVIKTCLIDQIIPAIKRKWPPNSRRVIYIQQDNAKPHIRNEDPDFRRAASSDGFDIRLVNQPPNSPDLNVNDLGWFRAIQSIQIETSCYTVEQLVNAVKLSFDQLTAKTLNKVFLSLQSCMVEIIKARGHNNYKIPHMNKEMLIRQQLFPTDLQVSDAEVKGCITYMLD